MTGAASAPVAYRDDLALGGRLADAARRETLAYFRTDRIGTENKAARGFVPVTASDRAAEAAMRAILTAERPEDGVLGEEEAARPTRSGRTWVLDPIDGTRAFVTGLPVWGVLIALDDGTGPRIGAVDQPFTGERFVGLDAPGGGAWLEREGASRPIATRKVAGLSAATLLTTDPALFGGAEAAAFAAIRGAARLTRLGTDCYGYAMVALGQADLVVETGLQPYDIAAPAALIRAAGGIVTNWEGGADLSGGRALAAGCAAVHAEALALLSS